MPPGGDGGTVGSPCGLTGWACLSGGPVLAHAGDKDEEGDERWAGAGHSNTAAPEGRVALAPQRRKRMTPKLDAQAVAG